MIYNKFIALARTDVLRRENDKSYTAFFLSEFVFQNRENINSRATGVVVDRNNGANQACADPRPFFNQFLRIPPTGITHVHAPRMCVCWHSSRSRSFPSLSYARNGRVRACVCVCVRLCVCVIGGLIDELFLLQTTGGQCERTKVERVMRARVFQNEF